MATFKSRLMAQGAKHRGIYSGQEYTIEGVVKLANGTVLSTSDVMKFFPIGENQVVTKVWAYAIGATGLLQVSIGYAQRLGADGNPEVVYRYGPLAGNEGKFTSPTSDPDAFAPAAVLTTARQVTDTAVEKLAGPVDLIAEVTTGATLGADVEIHIGATIIGELADREPVDPYFGYTNDYLLND